MKRLIRIWVKMAKMVILPDLITPWSAIFFVIGKIVRVIFYFLFIFSITQQTKGFLNYSPEEVVLFFMVFVIIDSLVQIFFRGVYVFRFLIVGGGFDLDLLKPLPSYFRPLFGHFDLADFFTIFPFAGFTAWFVAKNNLVSNFQNVFFFFIFLIGALLFSFGFHLLVCSIGILTLEVDHLIWIYRDLTAMARFPTDIYRGAVRFVLTFIFPVVLLITFPVKGLLGLLSWKMVLLSLTFGIILAYLSLKFWHWSLKRYTSASS